MIAMCRLFLKLLFKQRRRKKVMATSCHCFLHNKFFATKPSKKVVVATITFFCGGVAEKKVATTMCYCIILKFLLKQRKRKKGTVASYCRLLCNKTSNKTTKKNEEKGGSLPSSSQFYLLAFALSLQAPIFGSHFYLLAFALSLQAPVLGSHFYLLTSSSHFKLQVSSSRELQQWSERKMK